MVCSVVGDLLVGERRAGRRWPTDRQELAGTENVFVAVIGADHVWWLMSASSQIIGL
jgi:hypothetical protein